ncbi:hypothetical protein SISNIDRAFT_497613 [Sistotremastrum niveocremeum HHB9708]|uniref:Ubiquitin 3 binding protein But2 C-terminal domain-containing protein n=1 Tax=Sistotremastrum niveocremeum HHB9708 TaxID=1314777 RepID=A0A164Q214_9AGAM|nr:hypothetical protein SISNIDRAFT_497613 [Sistotremastrum niveocremeum HHB9708]
MWKIKNEKYSLLPSNSSSQEDVGLLTDENTKQNSGGNNSSKLSILAILLTILNLSLLAGNIFSRVVDVNQLRAGDLSRPNQYPGIDKIDFTGTQYTKMVKQATPIQLSQVSNQEPHKVFPTGPRGHMTNFGWVGPDDRHFVLTNEISTIGQFRTRDYGAQQCTLHFYFPEEARRPKYGWEDIPEVVTWDIRHHVDVNIYFLDAGEHVFNERTLNHDNKPARSHHLGTVTIGGNSTIVTERFHCETNTLYSFEFECASEDCFVDSWQDEEAPKVGVRMEQSTERW